MVIIAIWGILIVNLILTIAGYCYYLNWQRTPAPRLSAEVPFVSILVPAHNEGKVLQKTVSALLEFDYPAQRYELIVINDYSSDNSAAVLTRMQAAYQDRNFQVINTDAQTGGKGKSNALNIGLKRAKGTVISVYDADNTPEAGALRYLVATLIQDAALGAVIGKFRTRNRTATMLTRFINIETLAYQWMVQAGRQQLLKLCTIPGTNYVIRRSVLDQIGGWDVNALAEDTEISFQVYRLGKRIAFQPWAVTWEQEPQTLDVWFHQRARWVKGNIYVILKNVNLLFHTDAKVIWFDLLYLVSTYFLLMFSLVFSDIVFVLSVADAVHITLQEDSGAIWLAAILMFILSTFMAVTTEKGEMTLANLGIVSLMYFIYSQMWLAVAIYGMVGYTREQIFHQQAQWYKTKRY
nr:glycosyltransferase family 2 protein [Secundilactobacillus pentosiphilus]